MPFFEEGRKGPGGFDEGIEVMTAAVLSSPDFLYRAIAPSTDANAASQELTRSSSRRGSPSSYGARVPTTSC